jgi:hypothetical protein
LWEQSGHDGEKYRALMLQHGLLIPLKPGEKPDPLPCGWPARRVADGLLLKVSKRTLGLIIAYPDQRDGQIAFNALHDIAPDVAEKIRGTDADPFHDDERLDAFWTAVEAADRP